MTTSRSSGLNREFLSAINFKHQPPLCRGLFFVMVRQQLKNFLNDFLDLIYPPICLSCSTSMESYASDLKICEACRQKFEPVTPGFVEQMILKRLPDNYLDSLMVCFFFNEIVQQIIHHIKYNKMMNLGLSFGRFASGYIQGQLRCTPDLIIPVPLHAAREKERGYNQSEMIAKGIFENRRTTVVNNGLIRKRDTPSQTKLNRQERQKNVEDAFLLNPNLKLDGKIVVLVDDVVTTGATINSCAHTCKKAGATAVFGVAIATPPMTPDCEIPHNLQGAV